MTPNELDQLEAAVKANGYLSMRRMILNVIAELRVTRRAPAMATSHATAYLESARKELETE